MRLLAPRARWQGEGLRVGPQGATPLRGVAGAEPAPPDSVHSPYSLQAGAMLCDSPACFATCVVSACAPSWRR